MLPFFSLWVSTSFSFEGCEIFLFIPFEIMPRGRDNIRSYLSPYIPPSFMGGDGMAK